MDQGRIIERGTHHQLLALGGLYNDIYELQLKDQEEFQEEMENIDTLNMKPVNQGNYAEKDLDYSPAE